MNIYGFEEFAWIFLWQDSLSLPKKEHIFAFELLYRDSGTNAFPIIDGDIATLEVLTHSFLTIGINNLAGEKLCFINFTENLLDNTYLIRFHLNA